MPSGLRLICLAVLAAWALSVSGPGTPRALAAPYLPHSLTQAAGDPTKYTVKAGDSLLGIAETFGVTPAAIQEANGISDPNFITAGVVLTIPGATAGPAPAQPAAPAAPTKYTVKAGDSLTGIAASFGVSVAAIQQANGLQDPNAIKVGMVLTIPAAGQPAPAPAPAPVVKHTVKAGDSLLSIAANYGVAPADIQTANGIADPNLVRIGMVLTIPGAKQPAPAPTQPTPTPRPTPAPQPPAIPAPTQAAQPAAPAQTSPTPAPAAPAATPAPSGPPKDPYYFEQTGFRIANDKFFDYFNKRGGVRTFGYPASKEFTLFGFRVQFFQRLVMQMLPDGSVTTMNLLDEGILPFTRMNFSTFPGPDKGMADSAPKPGSDQYFARLLGFVKEKTPDQWAELPVSFFKTFSSTVCYEEAYPERKMDPGIMPAINLELWGAPISAPAYDPTNKNFIYQRFQRGIMHYDKTNGTTQGLLLGDYLKAVITGFNLPPDLDEQARGSRLYKQYNPLTKGGVNRPNELPGTDMTGAFTRDGLVVIDPGHGGSQVGAAFVWPDSSRVVEKDLNLKVSQKVAGFLRASGRQVMLTRTTDTQMNNPPKDLTGDGKMTLDDDLQGRIDFANNAGAELFLSIHFNGNSDRNLNGTEMYYNRQRPFSDKNKKFAQLLLDNVLASTKAAGFNLANRGVRLDENAVGLGNSFYLLGPPDEDKPRATMMVGALVEGCFLTNEGDAGMAKQEKFLDALAAGYAQAIQQYFQSVGR